MQVENALQNLQNVQDLMNRDGCSDDLLVQEQFAQYELNKALYSQEMFWMEKARVDWHMSDDRNTAYFHKLTEVRNASKRITMLKNGEHILDK